MSIWGGLYLKHPVKVYQDDLEDWYYDTAGDLMIENTGLNVKDGCITFASTDKAEVEHFILGAKCTMQILREWARV